MKVSSLKKPGQNVYAVGDLCHSDNKRLNHSQNNQKNGSTSRQNVIADVLKLPLSL
jgi:hypothetical protein